MPVRLATRSDIPAILAIMRNNKIQSQAVSPAVWDADLVDVYFFAEEATGFVYTNGSGTVMACMGVTLWRDVVEEGVRRRFISINRMGIHTSVTLAQIRSRIIDLMRLLLSQMEKRGITDIRWPFLPGTMLSDVLNDISDIALTEDVPGGTVLHGTVDNWRSRYDALT